MHHCSLKSLYVKWFQREEKRFSSLPHSEFMTEELKLIEIGLYGPTALSSDSRWWLRPLNGTSAVNYSATRDGVRDLYCRVKTTTELRPIYLRSVMSSWVGQRTARTTGQEYMNASRFNDQASWPASHTVGAVLNCNIPLCVKFRCGKLRNGVGKWSEGIKRKREKVFSF